jgi:manganese-dependent inorganic pyrophosphatase
MLFTERNYIPNTQTATLMIAAIVSDTLFFRSPTTTDADRTAVTHLNTIAQIPDLESFAMAMFDAKSDLTGMSPDDIVTMDYKIFTMGKKKIAI